MIKILLVDRRCRRSPGDLLRQVPAGGRGLERCDRGSREAGVPVRGPRLRARVRHLHGEAGLSCAGRPRARGGASRAVSRAGAAGGTGAGVSEEPARAVAIVRHFLESGKPIAANCHGPLLVLAAGSVKGKTLTCYPDLEPDIKAAGGEFVNRDVVVDGSLVTVRGWPDNGPWMREFVRLLKRTYDDREERQSKASV